jgi:cytochrome c551/c552
MRSVTIPSGLLLIAILALGIAGCGGGDHPPSGDAPAAGSSLSDFELRHGIGPVTEELVLGELDPGMAERGQVVFEFNCEACHLMDDRFVGPALGDVLDRRSATFVMNMILNPEEMARDHPEGQKMLQEYPLIMPFQNISEDEARAIVEYLRTVQP